MNGVNILVLNARLQALENSLWGYLNVELEEMRPGASKEYRIQFLEFFLENLKKQRNTLPDFLAQNPIVKNGLEQNFADAARQIAELENELDS